MKAKESVKGRRKVTWKELNNYIEEAKKSTEFRKELKDFIRVTTS